MKTPKTELTTIDQYFEMYPKEVQARLTQIRKAIHQAAPDAVETISYSMPAFKLNGKGLAYFAAFKNHIGFYPYPTGVKEFEKETSDYVTSKGGIQFPNDKPIPLDLVKKIIKFRVKENLSKY